MTNRNPQKDKDWREPLRRSEVATDLGISLARIHWDFFATMTFAGVVPKNNVAHGMAFAWLQDLAKKSGVPYNRLLVALRGEAGEGTGRFHFHCLVGGTFSRNCHTSQHQAEWIWKRLAGGAREDVRQYDRSLAGADYVSKCLGADAYELNKFNFANTVTLFVSVARLMAGTDSSGERHGGDGHMKKQDGARAVGEGAGRDALCDETSSPAAGMAASALA